MQLPIVKTLCSAGHHEAAALIKELVKNMEEISLLTSRELMLTTRAEAKPNPSEDVIREIRTLARDSIEHAKSK